MAAIALSLPKGTAQAGNAPEAGILYFVNTTSDTVVGGACANGAAGCSLRGAIQAANSHIGDDGIEFDLPAGSVINLTQALPDLTEAVIIAGPGVNPVTVRRDTGGNYRILTVTTPDTVTFSGLTISNGSVLGEGGGIYKDGTGTLNVTNCTLSGNQASNGGGLANCASTVNVTNSTLNGNRANAAGGILNFGGGTLNITNSTLSSNQAHVSGGGFYNNFGGGTVNVTNSTLSGNQSSKEGGGFVNFGPSTVNVTNSTLSGNQASKGGGFITFGSGTVNVTNSTLSGNQAHVSGGGFYNSGSGGSTVNVTNSTLSGNQSVLEGGGIFNNDTVNIKSSIIALNTGISAAPEVSGPVASGGFNLIGKNDGAAGSFPAGNPNANNDIVGTGASPIDPKLDPTGLQTNGGPTQTIALLFGSPAIDKGTSAGLTGNLTTDQRGAGFPRTFDDPATPNATGGDGTDVGAFELQTAPSVLGNISTRLRVETGDNVLIGGFIITGTQPKKIILRAIGPSLSSFFPGALADPILELRDSSGALISSNDNWRSDQEAEIVATTIPPSNDLESAIVASLPANNSAYTAIVRGANNATGIGVVEAYDLDRAVDSKLGNISTRGLIQTGDDVLIGGLIVLGDNPLRAIVRAIGPSLPVAGALENPTLELHDGNGALIASNDNWRTDQEAEIIATGIPPSNDLEPAILRDFAPGNYTAIVRGVNSATGVAVVEAYALN